MAQPLPMKFILDSMDSIALHVMIKELFFVNLTDPDLNSQFTINTDLQHYVNETDFDSVGTGDYSMTDDYLDDDYCHFTLYLSLDDNSQNNATKLEPGSVRSLL
tara:strand:+ start:1170 stop:1481 length:312 start_codon:yes stop_codon:yes gene_type:complete